MSLFSIANDYDGVRRLELKYRLNYFQYYQIRNALQPYMKPDHYTTVAQDNKYLVRSLYFETYDYRACYEKMNGESERVKFRLRTYNNSLRGDPIIRAELKARKANNMEKYSAFVSAADYLYFMRYRHWPKAGDPVRDEFERHLHLKELQPQVLVEYRREGYISRDKDDLRITLDHRTQSAHTTSLFPPQPVFFRLHQPHTVILEIKFCHAQPAWLYDLVRRYGLKIVANSKYAQGIQIARQDLYYSNGVVVIR